MSARVQRFSSSMSAMCRPTKAGVVTGPVRLYWRIPSFVALATAWRQRFFMSFWRAICNLGIDMRSFF
jgi:hypothetical protein